MLDFLGKRDRKKRGEEPASSLWSRTTGRQTALTTALQREKGGEEGLFWPTGEEIQAWLLSNVSLWRKTKKKEKKKKTGNQHRQDYAARKIQGKGKNKKGSLSGFNPQRSAGTKTEGKGEGKGKEGVWSRVAREEKKRALSYPSPQRGKKKGGVPQLLRTLSPGRREKGGKGRLVV